MSTTDTTRHIDVAPARRPGLPYLAVALGVVALLLSFVGWDWFAWGGIVLGVPAGAAALILGLRARRDGARALGTVAIALAAPDRPDPRRLDHRLRGLVGRPPAHPASAPRATAWTAERICSGSAPPSRRWA